MDGHPQVRVLSLLSAATEVVWRLGCGQLLAGRSHECDHPPPVLHLPAVSQPRIDPSASSEAIDAAVRRHAANREPVYALDADAVAAVAPTVVIAQDHCRVCAITADDLSKAVCENGLDAEQVILKPTRLADVFDDIRSVAKALRVPSRGEALVDHLMTRMNDVAKRCRALIASENVKGELPRVAVMEWNSPLMGCGYWIPELVETVQGKCVCSGGPGGKTPVLSPEDLVAAAPSVVIFALCGFDIPRAVRELRACGLLGSAQWQSLEAQGCRAFVMDGNALVNRSGPRLVESVEAFAEAVHPELQGFYGHLSSCFLMDLSEALRLHPPAASSAPPPVPADAPPRSPKLTARDHVRDVSRAAPNQADVDVTDGKAQQAAIQATVQAQLQALRCGPTAGAQAAFVLNSPANQERFGGSAQRFYSILGSSPAFSSLLDPLAAEAVLHGLPDVGSQRRPDVAADCQAPLPTGEEANRASQAVLLPDGTELSWQMVLTKEEGTPGSWMTDGVRVVSLAAAPKTTQAPAIKAPAKAPARIPTIVVAGTHSGVGKTSVAVGLMRALTDRGLKVAPFKVGPDFLDPLQHKAAVYGRCGSINLDGWMAGQDGVLRSFLENSAGADIAVVEGVMGVFDGRDGKTETGSTAEVAKWLGAPVLLVLDCWALSRSAAALVHGYCSFDPSLDIKGLVLNKVGGDFHTKWLKDAISTGPETAAEVLCGLPKSEAVTMKERHLGLEQPTADGSQTYLAALGDLLEKHADLDQLIGLAMQADLPMPFDRPPPCQLSATTKRTKIALAKDAAFCFVYYDSLRLLEAFGAEIVTFSPLAGEEIPCGAGAVFLPGGYPELHAEALAQRPSTAESIRRFASAGGFVYAECGGLMYCSAFIDTTELDAQEASKGSNCTDGQKGPRRQHPMVGLLPFGVAMRKRMEMGYITATSASSVETESDIDSRCPFPPIGISCKGQVYHFSHAVDRDGRDLQGSSLTDGVKTALWLAKEAVGTSEPAPEGYTPLAYQGRVVATYAHLYLPSAPEFGRAFVAAAQMGALAVDGSN